MTSRRALLAAFIVLLVAGAMLLSRRRPAAPAPVPPAPRTSASASPVPVTPLPAPPPPPAAAPIFADAPSHLADELNSRAGSIHRDLEILNDLFVAWQSNFPHTGNPVGENAEITAALTGNNPLHVAFVPPNHPAINAHGELYDRWGTPFRFHQISGTNMEIRSAGPDRKFGTPDDATWPPRQPF